MKPMTDEEWNAAPRASDDIPPEDVAAFFAEVDRVDAFERFALTRHGGALLATLTDGQLSALNQWTVSQPGDPSQLDLKRWPGWEDVAARRSSVAQG